MWESVCVSVYMYVSVYESMSVSSECVYVCDTYVYVCVCVVCIHV